MKSPITACCLALALAGPAPAADAPAAGPSPDAAAIKDIKAYCLDFNWAVTDRKRKPFASPGTWADADPAQHVAWYKMIGANVIQTFCVSNNGYAWYKNGFVPEQPGLKHDFLPEVVKLGHQEGMLVFGYFCVAANQKWGTDHPDLSYGTPTTYHIPYTDEYLAYLTSSIGDAVKRTGIDGIMIDWLWMPERNSFQWLDCEKKLYRQLMGGEFPGEDKLIRGSPLYRAYGRKALERCWKAIRKAAKDANPKCIVWLTSNQINHPMLINSDMYKEVDWIMNECGDMKRIEAVKAMIGPHTRLITCLADWNGQDARQLVPAALAAGVGLYGFAAPRDDHGLVPLDKILSQPVAELSGDDRNIAMLARAYHGAPINSVWNGKDGFVRPDMIESLRRIGSTEGFKPYDGNPILQPGPAGSFDAGALGSMCVVRVGEVLHLYYEAWGVRAAKNGTPAEFETLQIGHATSPDGLHWTKDPLNPALPRGGKADFDRTGVWDPYVIHEDGLFKMWYGGGGSQLNLGWAYATSDDGIHWQARNMGLVKGHDADVLRVADDLYLMVYSPQGGFDANGTDIRLAVYNGRLPDLVHKKPLVPAEKSP